MNRLGPAVLAAGLLAVVGGVEPWAAAVVVLHRVGPVIGFLLVVAVAADLVDDAGLFDVVADACARVARGRVAALFALFVAMCVVATWLLSLDTTAVLVTPVALTLAARLRLDPRPFALTALWLANTASLALPVANLTNLLAVERLSTDIPGYVRLVAAPQAATIGVTVVVLVVLFGRQLAGRYEHAAGPDVARGPVVVAAAATLGLGVAVVAGVEPWIAATGALLVLAAALRGTGCARPARLVRLVPWAMAAFVLGLFLVVDALVPHVSLAWLPGGDGVGGRLAIASAGAVGANVVDNLPAFLALESAADTPRRLAALLVGVNAGPLVTPWGSLATLLWLRACAARGVRFSAAEVAAGGLVVAVLAVTAGALAA